MVSSQTVRNGAIQKFAELLDTLARLLMVKRLARGQSPIAANRNAFLFTHKNMGGRQSLDIREGSGPGLADHVEEQKIGYREIVQFRGNSRMLADAIQRIAQDEQRA